MSQSDTKSREGKEEYTIYDVDYFISKFSAIPEDMWITNNIGTKGGPRCALGHCLKFDGWSYYDYYYNQEINELRSLFSGIGVSYVNNGRDPRYQQPTPKQRVLAALRDIKLKEQ